MKRAISGSLPSHVGENQEPGVSGLLFWSDRDPKDGPSLRQSGWPRRDRCSWL
ncbi:MULTISPECIES: hypothetical protein [Prochlorococcus]|uniref:hypothetical protein n=1 Tax=Prochlorococcus TaxID=1218 RepID=UPI001F26F2B7|nr:hypothetical protein [Prochlorococcus marinus]